jgi:WD repeat-containing protein 35
LVIAVDSFLYFANIKPDYQWAYFDSNVCHAFQTSESSHTKLMYWNPKSGEQITKTVQDFLFMTANGQHCLTVRKSPIDPTRAILAVCNGIGVQFETKTIDFIPKYAALNKSTVIVASESIILQWTFKSLTSVKPSALDSLRRKENRDDKYYHIDDIQSGEKGITLQDLILRQSTVDPISSITVSDSVLLLGRQSGCIIHVNLPVFQFEVLYHAPISPSNLAINSNSTRFSILDKNGVLRLHDLNTKTHSGNLIEVERKDVWDLKWSLDNPQMLAVSEKTKTFVINGVEVEEPQPSTGCIFD